MTIFDNDPAQDARAAKEQLSEIVHAANRRSSSVESELEELKREYASLLINLEMGRSDDIARKFELRVAIRALEYELDDFTILTAGFENERAKIDAGFIRARGILEDRERYKRLQERIEKEGPGLALVRDLRLWARKLDCQEECEVFLRKGAA
jgi:hypothetical protein